MKTIKKSQLINNGTALANLFWLMLRGECGPFGNEDPDINKNKLTCYSQTGKIAYTFYNDGSVDVEYGDDFKRNELHNFFNNEWDKHSFEELDEYYPEYYESIDDLLKSGDGWFSEINTRMRIKELLELE